ncbi:MAG TPA: hypothetical protein VM715_21030, partial [Candidatus Acidoferrum sp.]|nr:hypothetical protein [Candidatus Acidoferrum sp.]
SHSNPKFQLLGVKIVLRKALFGRIPCFHGSLGRMPFLNGATLILVFRARLGNGRFVRGTEQQTTASLLDVI